MKNILIVLVSMMFSINAIAATIEYEGDIFSVEDAIQVQYPELIDLLLQTESIDSNDKQDWLDLLPSMTDDQIDRLFNILMTERIELQQLELQYQ